MYKHQNKESVFSSIVCLFQSSILPLLFTFPFIFFCCFVLWATPSHVRTYSWFLCLGIIPGLLRGPLEMLRLLCIGCMHGKFLNPMHYLSRPISPLSFIFSTIIISTFSLSPALSHLFLSFQTLILSILVPLIIFNLSISQISFINVLFKPL